MFINILVVAITVLVLAFVIVWLLSPGLRSSIEEPKYAVAKWDHLATDETRINHG